MARIRSIHPSLFTDEAWVSCSPVARILYIGLMTDADDQGLFEWKPLQIKMRLLPADGVDVPSLLAELVAAKLISELTSGGKRLGAIRKFRTFQRPKKPSHVFSLPPEWAAYVGLGDAGSVPGENPGGTGGEKSPQMEDGGCRMEDGAEPPNPPPGDVRNQSRFREAYDAFPEPGRGYTNVDIAANAWLTACIDAGGEDALFGAVQSYGASAAARADGGKRVPSMHKWLTNKRYLAFLGASRSVHRGQAQWTGPPEIRAFVVAAKDEAFAASYLDPARWQEVPVRAVIGRTGVAADKLRREAGDVFSDAGVEVQDPQRASA